ncbi:MAG: H-NS histone family protein [Limnobacter sp.]|nr:H-NS histone family protein [Limnobacter sp.]
MRKTRLSALSASELVKLKDSIEKELTKRSEKIQAMEEVKKYVASKGLNLEEVFSELGAGARGKSKSGTRAKLGPVAIQFRHPKNPELTWKGRGKRPNWLKEAIESGISEEKLRVN